MLVVEISVSFLTTSLAFSVEVWASAVSAVVGASEDVAVVALLVARLVWVETQHLVAPLAKIRIEQLAQVIEPR